MTNNHFHRPGMIAAPGSGQPAGTSLAPPGAALPFAQAGHQADPGAVWQLFGAGAADRAPKVETPALRVPYSEEEQDAEPAGVLQLLGAALPEPELSGTGFTYRHNWGARRGQWLLRLNWAAVNPRSRVLVSIGEGVAGGTDSGKFIGGARYSLHNVAPRAGGADIWVNVEWGSNILLYVDYLVVNP